MNINNFNIFLYTKLNNRSYDNIFDGILNNPASWEGWIFFIVGIVFMALCGLFIWLYFECKSTADSLLARSESHSAWSFIGFWGRYRGAILAFTTAVFLLLGAAFIFGGLTGFVIDSGIG